MFRAMAARKFLEKSAASLKIALPDAVNDPMHSARRLLKVAGAITKKDVVEKLGLAARYVRVP